MTNEDERLRALGSIGSVGIIGAGAVGTALARALAARGAHIAALASRYRPHAEALAASLPGHPTVTTPDDVAAAADLVFLAVPDDAIAALAAAVHWRTGQALIHLSGARGAEALSAALSHGAVIAALHPLMTFPRVPPDVPVARVVERFTGCVWALETTDDELAARLERLVAALDGRVLRLTSDDRVPYHLSGVLASNYVATLLGAAVRLWEPFGIGPDEALRALLPLLRATVANLETTGLPGALTGPIARGDQGTIAAHLAWLADHASDDPEHSALRDAYIALARLALPIAEAKGILPSQAAASIRELLAQAARHADRSGG